MANSLQDLNDNTWLEEAATAALEKPSLTERSQIETLARGFFGMVLILAHQVSTGEIPRDAMGEKLEAEAKRLQDIFFGKDPGYAKSLWNTEDHLGRFIVSATGLGGDRSKAVENMFLVLTHEFMGTVGEYLRGKVTEELMIDTADEIVERTEMILLGMPAHPEE